jgi:hypothetical protein
MTSSGSAKKIYIAARFRVKEEVSHPSLLAWPRASAFIFSICWRESWQAWTCLWKNLKKWVGVAGTLTKDNFSRAFQRWLESWKLVFVLVMELSKKVILFAYCMYLVPELNSYLFYQMKLIIKLSRNVYTVQYDKALLHVFVCFWWSR